MEDTLLALFVGVKLAVFSAVFVYALLAQIVSKSHGTKWLGVAAGLLSLLAAVEFLHILGTLMPQLPVQAWLLSTRNLSVVISTFSIIAGVGLALFLSDVNKHPAVYR